MATVNVDVNEYNEAVIVCPACRRTKHIHITHYQGLGRPLKVKCACGASFRVNLSGAEQPAFVIADGPASAPEVVPASISSLTTSHAVSTGTEAGSTRQPSFHGEAIPLFGLDMAKRFLGYVTLGLYHFWGRTKIRTYLVNQTEFAGDRFTFHGNGKELLLGWLKAILVYGLVGFVLPFGLAMLFGTFLGSESLAGGITVLAIVGVNQLILPVIMVNSRRYRLSHTSWRGIHFSFRGRVLDFLKIYLKGTLLTMLTAGVYYPFFSLPDTF